MNLKVNKSTTTAIVQGDLGIRHLEYNVNSRINIVTLLYILQTDI